MSAVLRLLSEFKEPETNVVAIILDDVAAVFERREVAMDCTLRVVEINSDFRNRRSLMLTDVFDSIE